MENQHHLAHQLDLMHQGLRSAKWRRLVIMALSLVFFMTPMAIVALILGANLRPGFLGLIVFCFPMAVVVFGWMFISVCQEIAGFEKAISS